MSWVRIPLSAPLRKMMHIIKQEFNDYKVADKFCFENYNKKGIVAFKLAGRGWDIIIYDDDNLYYFLKEGKWKMESLEKRPRVLSSADLFNLLSYESKKAVIYDINFFDDPIGELWKNLSFITK